VLKRNIGEERHHALPESLELLLWVTLPPLTDLDPARLKQRDVRAQACASAPYA
jgi:hypothetical protein